MTREALYVIVPDAILDTAMQYTMSQENLNDIFARIDGMLQVRGEERVELIIVGGPPCQAFSLA